MTLHRDETGVAVLYTALLLPTFMLLLALVVEVGALRVTRARLTAVADLAATSAVNEQDLAALAADGRYRVSPLAAGAARDLLERGLEPLAARLADGASPHAAAADADIAVLAPGEFDPVSRRSYDAPTVRVAARLPVRTPLLTLAALRDVTHLSILSAASAR